jgi:catechol 2,3-dioxygenase-like lactoylglutathione lyase family enzyme
MTGLNAITFHTTDMARACAFWEASGMTYAYGGPSSAFTSLRAGGGTFVNLQHVELHEPGSGWGRIIIHVDSPDDTHVALVEAGYRPHAEPADAPWDERYFHVTDPDGNEVSFARPL